MSYTTPSIGNRLGISFGWTTDRYPSLHTYAAEVQNTIRLYWFIKEYFNKNNIMLVHYKFAVRKATQILYLAIYKYQQRFNLQTRRKKKRNLRRKKKWIKMLQSTTLENRKRTKKRFLMIWKRPHRNFKTYSGWRAINKKISIRKHRARNKIRRKIFLARRACRPIGNIFKKPRKSSKKKILSNINLKKKRKKRRIWRYLRKQIRRYRIKKRALRKKRRLRGWTFLYRKNSQLLIKCYRQNFIKNKNSKSTQQQLKNSKLRKKRIKQYIHTLKKKVDLQKLKLQQLHILHRISNTIGSKRERFMLSTEVINKSNKTKTLSASPLRLKNYLIHQTFTSLKTKRTKLLKKLFVLKNQLPKMTHALQFKSLTKRLKYLQSGNYLHKLKKKSKRFKQTNKHIKLKRKFKKRWFERMRIYSPEFYNHYISMLALRFKLRSFLRAKQFYLTNINITEPITVANKKAIKMFARSHWYVRLKKFLFFSNTVRLLHVVEKYPNATMIAEHFAKELFNVRKKHWNLIRAFSIILKYWRFHSGVLLNRKELARKRGENKKKARKITWIPRYKLYSPHDSRKTIRGIKICIKGKINSTDRTRVRIIQEGIIPIQSFNQNVIYAIAHARVKTGAFGIKVWIYT